LNLIAKKCGASEHLFFFIFAVALSIFLWYKAAQT